MRVHQGKGGLIISGLCLVLLAMATAGWAAEPSWVSDEVKLNLRSGAGTEYRITGTLSNHQPVTVLRTSEGWAQVKLDDERTGWIPGGYLTGSPPPRVQLSELEKEAHTLRARLGELEAESSELKQQNSSFTATQQSQRGRLEALTNELDELRSAVRWREWVTGASILTIGILAGAIVSRRSRKRRGDRLRV